MPATNSKKFGTEASLPLGTTTFSFIITICNHWGTEDINCCSFASGIFAHSCDGGVGAGGSMGRRTRRDLELRGMGFSK